MSEQTGTKLPAGPVVIVSPDVNRTINHRTTEKGTNTTMDSVLILLLFAGIVLLGFLAQWLSWWIRIPSIIVLFVGGFIAGPLTGVLSPTDVFGDLLVPTVSALIGIILFEAGLNLNLDELEDLHGPVFRVIFVGGSITFLLTAALAYGILGFSVSLSFLLGGILVVTGPTVVIPLLQQIRPKGDIGSVARWEGIIIDPLGAILAVIVFELIQAGTTGAAMGFGMGLLKFLEALLVGVLIGLFVAYVLVLLLDRYWIPDHLHNLAILSGVLTALATSNWLVHESGLLAVTVMGFFMANQQRITVHHILDFKEDLRVLFISLLFIVLVAELDQSLLFNISMEEMIFLGALIFAVRPAAVLASTFGTSLSWPERGFLSWIAPRGIVAAAVASIFARALQDFGVEQATQLDDITFLVIAGTVLVYGLTLRPVARLLGLADTDPQGILFVGAESWVRTLAKTLQNNGVFVKVVDKNENNIREARNLDLNAECIDLVAKSEFQSLDVQGIGYCLAMTPFDEVNTLTALHALDLGFDRSSVFQIQPAEDDEEEQDPDPFRGRLLFGEHFHYEDIKSRVESGWSVVTLNIDGPEDRDAFMSRIPESSLPIVKLRGDTVSILSLRRELNFQQGDRVITFQSPEVESQKRY